MADDFLNNSGSQDEGKNNPRKTRRSGRHEQTQRLTSESQNITGTQPMPTRQIGTDQSDLAEQSDSVDEPGETQKQLPIKKAKRARRPNPIARLVNQWFDRVMGAVKGGGFSGQEEEYASHRTTRDFIWNTIGAGSWGVVLPIVSMVATQLVGAEQAGMVTMAFTIGLLLMFVGNFGVRTYQVSDLEENYSFNDYQISRWMTCAAMIIVGIIYCAIRGYDPQMFTICMGVFVYRMIDGLADVYEGRLQQMDKMYLAGISQAIRSIAALVVFCIALLISFNAAVACVAMAVAAGITFIVVTYPLALLETPRSHKASFSSVLKLVQSTFPLFLAIFMFNLIDAMPRFVMESMLPYDNQLYYYALYFPAQGILMTVQLVYKPLLVRMAGVWHDGAKRRRFDLILVGILLIVIAITAVTAIIMMWIGVPILSFLYGIDFEEFRGLLLIMVVAGGVVAAIDFLYQVVTVMRRQRDVTTLYLVTFGFSIFIPILLIGFTGLPGAMLSYLIVEAILFVLLVWEYIRIRGDLSRNGSLPSDKDDQSQDQIQDNVKDQPQEQDDVEKLRPSEIRARRLKREEVMNRRVKNRYKSQNE